MAYLEDHKAKFENLRVSLELQHRDQLRRKANGGNSIIFSYPPHEEKLYIKKLKEINQDNLFELINVAELLVEYIDSKTFSSIERKYNIFKATPHKVFTPFKEFLLGKISDADKEKTPVLIRTGALYGTGIENVNIMEDKVVMELKQPLIIFYPSIIEHNNLHFLNFKPASKYRCTVIE